MRDGRTRKSTGVSGAAVDFLKEYRAILTVLRGPAAGHEIELDGARVVVGRSPDADLQLDEASVSHAHAAIELDSNGFAVRDLDSTNGICVNGEPTEQMELEHGDRIQMGNCEVQYVLEERDVAAKVWDLDELDSLADDLAGY